MNTAYCFIALGFLLFCVYMLRYALINHRIAKISNNWETITGKLTDLRLWCKRRINGVMVDSESVTVEYQYDVDDREIWLAAIFVVISIVTVIGAFFGEFK
jgi:hypothetical protein